MKRFCTLPLFYLLVFSAFSQSHPFKCLTPHHPKLELPKDFTKYQLGEKSAVKLQAVVHVIYHDSDNDLPDAVVEEMIKKVNEDFRRQNPDTVDTPNAFRPFAADTNIEFELATVDPTGGPTNGITHTQTPHEFFEAFELGQVQFDSTGGHSAWDPLKYVNIWLVRNTFHLGIALSPFSHGQPRDGVIVSCFYFDFERQVTHELGHYLGLYHPFNYDVPFPSPTDTCSNAPGGPDGLEDTPNQLNVTYSVGPCPDFPYTDLCSPDTPGVMFMNYMDFSPAACKNMFTHQQAAAMNWVLDSIRFSLFEQVTSTDNFAVDEKFEAAVFPNPVRDKLYVEFQNLTNAVTEYQLFDGMGKIKAMGQLESRINFDHELNIAHLPKGIYLLKIKSGSKIGVRKIIKL
ncbi:MAG: zinc-dependent metalloprotease [Bacteroidota bacterium]